MRTYESENINKMKTINFEERAFVLHTYSGKMEITEDDFKKLENNEIDIENLTSKYKVNFYDESISGSCNDIKDQEFYYVGLSED